MKKVSVIIPVYNNCDYLEKTIDCIFNQSYTNLEIIIVDDGSEESCGKICNQLSEKDSRVKLIHQSNQGICGARNTGLQHATGDYIAFCDHDDLMDVSCMQKAMEAAESIDADVVRFRREKLFVSDKDCHREHMPGFERYVIEALDDFASFQCVIRHTGYGIWAGIYKREYLEKHEIQFEQSLKCGYEDHVFVTQVLSYRPSVVVIPDILYSWVQRDSFSTSRQISTDKYYNKILGIQHWAAAERQLFDSIKVQQGALGKRTIAYLTFALQEIELYESDMGKRQALLVDFMDQMDIDKIVDCKDYSLVEKYKAYCINNRKLRLYYWGLKTYSKIRNRE